MKKLGDRVSTTLGSDGVALVTICNPPMNALHPDVLSELFANLEQCHRDKGIRAIVITGANSIFSAGFDIKEFQNPTLGLDSGDVNDSFTRLIEHGPKPTVAAINGIALGGGCEIVVACNARICTGNSKIGLPELHLGLIPGFGGTQRLPRLVGTRKALEMMLSSKPVFAKEALALGLIDKIVSQDKLLMEALSYSLKIADGRKPRILTLEKKDKIEPLSMSMQVCHQLSKVSRIKAPKMQHHQYCIQAVLYGIEHDPYDGLKNETELFAKCRHLEVHKALLHVFLATRDTKKIQGLSNVSLKPRKMQKVAVLGGGLMGSGIATALLIAGCEVFLKEINEKFLNMGIDRIKSNIESGMKRSKISKAQAEFMMKNLHGVMDFESFGNLDLVIEAVIENTSLKQDIFANLEKHCSKECILATNTSTIDIDIVGERVLHKERVVGAHFFSPAHIMPLLEIVKSSSTSKQVLADLVALASRIQKTPIVVGNCTGFAVNRVFFPYTMAACLLVDLGMNPYKIDKIISQQFGMPVGPFRLSDLVGADITMHVGRNFVEAFPDRVYITQLMIIMNQHNRLGEKTKKGFYMHDETKKAKEDADIDFLLNESRRASGLISKLSSPVIPDEEIIELIMFPVVNEGYRVVREGIVDKASDLDIASILGMGFPLHLGGLMFWADTLRANYIVKKLEKFSLVIPECSSFFKPSEYLIEAADKDLSLETGKPKKSL